MRPDDTTLDDVLDRLDITARYLSYLDRRLDDLVHRTAIAQSEVVAAVDTAAWGHDSALARTTRRCAIAFVCAQIGQLVAVAALLLRTRGWA
jgi:hypothetical protein